MIDPIIQEKLRLCKVADIPYFDDNTTTLIIDKKELINEDNIAEGDYYLIELEDYLLKPSDNFTFHVNWNRNIIPSDKFMKCEITHIMGKMIKIVGVGYDSKTCTDLLTSWEGWLPKKSVKFLKRL